NAERRAGDVVEPELVAERHRRRIAAVLAADADLELGLYAAALPDGDADQRADALLVEAGERVAREQALLQVVGEEGPDVVAREAERRLGEVVGAEGEEIGVRAD